MPAIKKTNIKTTQGGMLCNPQKKPRMSLKYAFVVKGKAVLSVKEWGK